jgi:hypothetical protein
MTTAIRRGVLRAFDSGSYTAIVEIAGSISTWLPDVPVALNIPSSDMVPGRRLALLLFDESNPRDFIVVAVWE